MLIQFESPENAGTRYPTYFPDFGSAYHFLISCLQGHLQVNALLPARTIDNTEHICCWYFTPIGAGGH